MVVMHLRSLPYSFQQQHFLSALWHFVAFLWPVLLLDELHNEWWQKI